MRGVPKSLAAVYAAPDGKFTCLDGSKTLPASAINDDFCDCTGDGSDEPGTSACQQGQFFCLNKGYRGKFIPSSLVNDGVCDCCDGSDEYASKAACKNSCLEDGAEWRRLQAESIHKAEEGARLRQEYAQAGTAAAAERDSKLNALIAKQEQAKKEKEEAEKVGGGRGRGAAVKGLTASSGSV